MLQRSTTLADSPRGAEAVSLAIGIFPTQTAGFQVHRWPDDVVPKPETPGSNPVLPVTCVHLLQFPNRVRACSIVGVCLQDVDDRDVLSGQRPMTLQERSIAAFKPGRHEDRKSHPRDLRARLVARAGSRRTAAGRTRPAARSALLRRIVVATRASRSSR